MRTFQEWTVLLIFGILDCVTGQLLAPLNITTESRNFSLFLTWLPAPGYPSDVTYIVKCRLYINNRWQTVPKCNRTFATECDLTCVLKENYTNLHALRVKAVSLSRGKSTWASLDNITYMFTVDPSPPILEIILGDGTMTINTSLKTPPCMPSNFHMYFTFLLEIKNNNNPAEQIRQREIIKPPETMKTEGFEGEYCIAGKTIHKMAQKTSGPSKTVCFTFTQKDESHQLMLLVGLPVFLLAICIVTLVCIIWTITNQKARTPDVLDFSHKRFAMTVSLKPEENPYPLTINKNMDQASSAKHLLSSDDSDSINEYLPSGCGYTERKTLQSDSLRRNIHDEESTSDEYMSSKSLPTNSSSDKSSDSSCVQTSGSNTAIQLHRHREEINTNVSDNMETLVTNTITMGPLLDTLHLSDSNGFNGVHLNTLSIATATDHCLDNETYDYNPADFEDSNEQLTNDCTDSDTSESHVESQSLQKNSSSGYEQRGYMIRR